MFELIETEESIYEGVVEPSYKKLLGKIPTVLVTAVKWEEKPPRQLLNTRQVRAMEISENGMQILLRIYSNWIVSSMACYIHQTNLSYWET